MSRSVAAPIMQGFSGKQFMNNSKINLSRSLRFSRSSSVLVLLLLFISPAMTQTKAPHSSAVATSSEQRTELELQPGRQNPLDLRHFLLRMPHAAPLHNHLTRPLYPDS